MSCMGHLQEALAKREKLCDEECEDFFKNCVIRNHIQGPYCDYKKKRKPKKENEK